MSIYICTFYMLLVREIQRLGVQRHVLLNHHVRSLQRPSGSQVQAYGCIYRVSWGLGPATWDLRRLRAMMSLTPKNARAEQQPPLSCIRCSPGICMHTRDTDVVPLVLPPRSQRLASPKTPPKTPSHVLHSKSWPAAQRTNPGQPPPSRCRNH